MKRGTSHEGGITDEGRHLQAIAGFIWLLLVGRMQ